MNQNPCNSSNCDHGTNLDQDKLKLEHDKLGAKSACDASHGNHSHAGRANETHSHGAHSHGSHSHGPTWFGEWTEISFVVVCGLALGVGWLIETNAEEFSYVALVFYIVAYFFGAYFTILETIESFAQKKFSIETLMLVAAGGAAFLGEWAEGALLLFLFSLGHALEHFALGKAKRAIQALKELTPDLAHRYSDGHIEDVPLQSLRIEDTVLVKPNEIIPVDGFIVNGSSSVNQASITGESIPVQKYASTKKDADAEGTFGSDNSHNPQTPHYVFAGTLNGSGTLDVQVAKLASDSTVARIVQMVESAESKRSPSQQFADRFERWFVPLVLLFVLGLIVFGALFTTNPGGWFYKAMAVLVASSPCALAIATPSAVLSSIATAARNGVLVKGGGPLEELGKVQTIALDKTGTVTEGKPVLVEVLTGPNFDQKLLFELAVALETLSEHPLARSILEGAKLRFPDLKVPSPLNVENVVGKGIRGEIAGQPVTVGNWGWIRQGIPSAEQVHWDPLVRNLQEEGMTLVAVRKVESVIGVFGIRDQIRANAREAILAIKNLGVEEVTILSGDHQKTVESVARALELPDSKGNLMPSDKLEEVARLATKGGVAMIGDGVNDAPAMAAANVAIAMGAAGSDVALETAEIALMTDDLRKVAFAVGLSRKTSSVIKQNLWFSLGMVALLIPATLFGLNMGAAVMFHEGSTLLVVLNGLRLLSYKDVTV